MPVKVLVSIVKDWYEWLVSGLVHLLSNDPFRRTGLMPCTLKPHNFKSMCRISKIITFLESLRQAGWFDLFESDIQALLIFDPLITLWGNFDAPYLKLLNDASVASACFYVRTCRRVRNSKKIATIRDFHLPGSFLCLSTRLSRLDTPAVGHGSWQNNCLDLVLVTRPTLALNALNHRPNTFLRAPAKNWNHQDSRLASTVSIYI